MTRNGDPLGILIEDLALQLLSARSAADQASTLHTRLDAALSATRPTKKGGRSASPRQLEIQRLLTSMSSRAGERAQETSSLVRTLEWNVRYYLALRERRRAGGARRGQREPSRAGRRQ